MGDVRKQREKRGTRKEGRNIPNTLFSYHTAAS
jgi:hypothetical protein